MALDLASPLIPGAFMLMASLGSISRAMVGMAAGATHVALTQHFTTARSNAADISAKASGGVNMPCRLHLYAAAPRQCSPVHLLVLQPGGHVACSLGWLNVPRSFGC